MLTAPLSVCPPYRHASTDTIAAVNALRKRNSDAKAAAQALAERRATVRYLLLRPHALPAETLTLARPAGFRPRLANRLCLPLDALNRSTLRITSRS